MIGISAVVNVVVSTYLYRQARAHDSPALEGDAAHLRADAVTSVAVLVGLVLIEVTGVQELDAIVALMVGSAIVYAGVRILSRSSRVLMDEALPADELDIVREAIADFPAPELVGFHKLRGAPRRQRAPHRPAPPVRARHLARARARDRARAPGLGAASRSAGADVLVHIEPSRRQSRRVDGAETSYGSRLTAADSPTNAARRCSRRIRSRAAAARRSRRSR